MTLDKLNTGPKSAKQYVYDLLIAEYLWNHNYSYTVSVFASEAPLLVNFQKHIPEAGSALASRDKVKLQTDYVHHTLETLGIGPEGTDGLAIIEDYAKHDVPLLLAILKYFSQFRKKPKNNVEIVRDDLKVPTKNCRVQTDFPDRDFSVENARLISARKKLVEQKESFDNELREKEEALKQRASHIERQMKLLDEKLSQIHKLEEVVVSKEKKLEEDRKEEERKLYRKELELSVRENSLIREAERLERERDSYRQFEANLKKLQEELLKVKQELSTKDNIRVNTTSVSVQTEKCNNQMMELSNDQEKRELQNLVHEQKLRIEELTLRAVRLSRQLEEVQLFKYTTTNDSGKSLKNSQPSKTILSESSSTDDVIQDAKQRLKRLEEETLKADQFYFNSIIKSPL
uniref:Uncharacterized protein n=1 Tax=Bracon brevicornis TaxID=1563983 RepID=A0A6V7KBE7_9HYME